MTKFIYLILTGQAYSQGLAYSSHTRLQKGQIVKVPIRTKSEYGIVLSPLNESELDFELNKLREINGTTDLILSSGVMEFMQTLAAQTFNLPSSIAAPLLANIGAIIKILKTSSQGLKINNLDNSKKVSKSNLSLANKNDIDKVWTEFSIFDDSDIYSRIINLIRIILSENKAPSTSASNNSDQAIQKILILYPESKYLSKVYNYINKCTDKENLAELKQLRQLIFQSNLLKSDREAMTEFCSNNLNSKSEVSITRNWPTTKYILLHSLRSGLFMPFDKIDHIILVDEANQNYIQEQNSLYFDSREAAYILAKAMGSKLYVIGNFPSARLWNYIKNEEKSQKESSKNIENNAKNIKTSHSNNLNFNITINNRIDFQDKDSLLSYKVEKYLSNLSSKHQDK